MNKIAEIIIGNRVDAMALTIRRTQHTDIIGNIDGGKKRLSKATSSADQIRTMVTVEVFGICKVFHKIANFITRCVRSRFSVSYSKSLTRRLHVRDSLGYIRESNGKTTNNKYSDQQHYHHHLATATTMNFDSESLI